MGKYRIDRLKKLIKEEVSLIIQNKMKDPRIGFVTVTDIELSKDLKQAQIFLSIMGAQKEKDDTMKALKGAEGFVWETLKKSIQTKYIPRISFVMDDSLERGNRILSLLNEIKEKE